MRKISFFMITILILTTITSIAFAADFPDVKNTKYEEAVDLLTAYEIIEGFPDGTFRPEELVTRAQMAKMLTVALGYKYVSEDLTSFFTDMSGHWAEQYVQIMSTLDIIIGYLDGSFKPDNNITYSEAVTMIVRALGYTDMSLPGEWPYDYYVKAGELGIVDGINISADNATRGDIAIMISNALNNKMIEVTEKLENKETNKTLLNKIGRKETEQVTFDYFAEESLINIEPYLFNLADVYYNIKDQIVFIGNVQTVTFSGTVTYKSGYNIFVTDEGGNRSVFNSYKSPIYYNGAKGKVSSLLNANVSVIYDKNGDTGNSLGIIAKEITDVMYVNKNDLYVKDNTKFIDKYLPLTEEGYPNYDNIIVTGAANSIFDIQEKDVLYFYETDEYNSSKSKITIDVIRDKIYGKITEIKHFETTKGYIINGEAYFPGDYYITEEPINLGYEVEAILDKDGKLVKFNILNYYNEPQTYGLVVGIENGIKEYGAENYIKLPQIKILNESGKFNIYEIEENSKILSKYDGFSSTELRVDLAPKDIIKFNIESNGKIRLIEKAETKNISGAFNYTSGLVQNSIITNDTFIFYQKDDVYELLSKDQLDEFISGYGVTNYKNQFDAIFLENGIKNTYSGFIYGILNEVSQVLDSEGKIVEKVYLYTEDDAYYTSSNLEKSLQDYTNKFVKLSMNKGKIELVEEVKGEIDITQVETIYKNLPKIDGTYYEPAGNAIVYICTLDEEGNINGAKKGTVEDVKIGTYVQFFEQKNDGPIDYIIIYENYSE